MDIIPYPNDHAYDAIKRWGKFDLLLSLHGIFQNGKQKHKKHYQLIQ